jgi:hypothetical protein
MLSPCVQYMKAGNYNCKQPAKLNCPPNFKVESIYQNSNVGKIGMNLWRVLCRQQEYKLILFLFNSREIFVIEQIL